MRAASLIPLFALALAACHQSQGTATHANPEAKPGFSIADGRLVLPAVKGNPAAAYFDVSNSGDKPGELAAVHVDGAKRADMHETVGDTMQPLKSLSIAAGATVHFAPGGKHVMVFDPAEALKPGGSTVMTLSFADGDKISAPLEVEAPGGEASEAMPGMSGGAMH
jgi:copper(I)-binding protein